MTQICQMSSSTSDEDLMKNVFQLRERLMRTESSLQKINRLSENGEKNVTAKLSFSEPYLQGASDSSNLPPPLTMDDLGELNGHDETDYSPIDESVLRQWNVNNATQQTSRSPSPDSHLRGQTSLRSSQSSVHSFKRNLRKNFSPRKLTGPSTSSPCVGRYVKRTGRAYSCDDIASAASIHEVFQADSYRMLKQPSVTSNFSVSAPISPRKNVSRTHYRAPSPSYSDTSHENSGNFQLMQPASNDSSLSGIADYTLQNTPGKSPQKDPNCDSTLTDGKENVTPARPVSARSNATSVTILGADAESDRLRNRLSMLREDNERLHTLVSSLKQQLETEKSSRGQRESRSTVNIKEEVLALKEEAEASEKALRRAEDALERSEMVCQKKIENIVTLKDEISHLKSLLTEAELSKESASKNYKEAYQDAQHLAQQLENVETKLGSVKRQSDKERLQHQQEIKTMEKIKSDISEKAAKLQHSNTQLHNELRNALLQLESNGNKDLERDSEKLHISRALQDLQSRFGEVRTDLKKRTEDLEDAKQEKATLLKKLEGFSEQNHLQQDSLASCQRELEEYRTKIEKLENDLRKSKLENQKSITYSSKVGTLSFNDGTSTEVENDDCRCESTSPRKQKAIMAELKMKLAAKEAQVQRLEARVNNFSMEAEKLEGIRGELINVVERSRLGDKRAHELEGIVHALEDERSKVTRQFMECQDELNDKNLECESLETRLAERTKNLSRTQGELEESQRCVSKLESEVRKYTNRLENLEKQLESKSSECEARYTALHRAEEELAEKKRTLENAAEWAGKREADSKRELEKIKKIHKEQHQEMEAQIDKLRSDCNRYRDQAREFECAVCQLRDENDVIIKRLKVTESELNEARNNDELARKQSDEALRILETKAKESSEQVTSLEAALTQCKSDIRQYVEQLEEASSKFNHQMAVKSGQVAKLVSDLNIAQESLKSESLHAQTLEANLRERQKIIDQTSKRIAELEECQACMQAKIAKYEHQLSKVNSRVAQEREHWEGRLQAACKELELKNAQFTQLNDALKEVDKEFSACRKELLSVEEQLEKLRTDSTQKSKQLENRNTEVNNLKTDVATTAEKVTNLEERLKLSETERHELQEKCITQGNELARAQAELQSVTQQSGQLHSAFQNADTDNKKKDTFISRLQNALREAKEHVAEKDRSIEELERALEDRQWELQQRAAQLGQLEVSVKEHKSISEKRQIELQSESRKAQIELKERNQQVSNLDEQLSNLRSELSEQRHEAEQKEQDLKRIGRESEQKDERIKSLEEALEQSRSSYEERHRACLEVTQELRIAREQSQKSAQQWQDAQRELSRLQRQQESLIGDLDAIGKAEKEKDSQVSELVGKLTASEAGRSGIEKRYSAELERVRNDVLKMHQQHQAEMARLHSEYARKLTEAKTTAGDRSEDLRTALEREQEAKTECEAMRDVMTSLEKELLARKQVIEAANDTIVVKEAEIARLEAKLAGVERGKKMQDFASPEKPKNVDQPDFLPSFLASDDKISPETEFRGQRSSKADDKRSPQLPHGSSTLFSGLDPDSSSLSPSFANIAASTKRPMAADDALARALAESPDIDGDSTASDIEMSLFVRVFDGEENRTGPDRDGVNTRGPSKLNFELRPEHCMADLRERLRASEQRRQEVTSKLRQLKSSGQS